MSLIACKNCGSQISKNASRCPRCFHEVSGIGKKIRRFIVGFDSGIRKKPCRSCGEVLKLDEHRLIKSSSYTKWIHGTSYNNTISFLIHIRCPRCGDSKPLILFGDTILHKVIFALPFILGIGSYYLFKFDDSYIPYLFWPGVGWFIFGMIRFPGLSTFFW